jgi:lipoprotein-anchoring transpeptidase ErfK/SrfK
MPAPGRCATRGELKAFRARYLYYVLPEGKAIRYGVIVGEDAQAWSGVAKIGRKEE